MPGAVLYLHGFASGPGSRKARFLGNMLSRRGIELETPDLTGGGLEALTITGQLEIVERVCGGRAVTLIGSSLGGYVAALYAARHPEVTRVVLLAPAFGFARHFLESIPAAELEKWRRTGSLPVFDYSHQRDGRVGYGLIEDGIEYEDYPEVSQPALVIHGTRDEVVPCRLSQSFAAGRANVRLMLIDSDHQLLSDLDRIGMWIAEFLR